VGEGVGLLGLVALESVVPPYLDEVVDQVGEDFLIVEDL
jgi:hypothetical protein